MAGDEKITAYVKETGESAYSVSIKVNGYLLKGDEPQSYGGADLGPAPYDLLLASLGECTAMTIRWYALQQKWPLEKVEVQLSHQKIDRVDTFEKQVFVHGTQLTDEQRKKLIDIAAKCPIQRTLQSEVVIRTVDEISES